ncbi:MAG: hypothetical protein COS40_13900 [Deltaproteobacteria bacterium CG03_land_8_20_14_0_80_45_14]|nr:MAG: hypothetical protein COS40_13900 [Deltaproteobacteria bacterium CG03_land_8_20_14_0_80_45_14]
MDCEKVRDRFSSLLEKELTPSEEKIAREHLSSCPECQRELGRFEKTMQWLHSVGEVEAPDGFLPELQKKMGEQKKATPDEKSRGRWFNFPLSLKLPIQAAALAAIVFLALYLTKMMPMEVSRLKDAKQTSSSLSAEKKSEQELVQKEVERERRALETAPETPRPKDVEQAKPPIPGEEKMEGANVPPVKAEAKKTEAPSSKTEVMTHQAIGSKEAAGGKVLSLKPGKIEKGLVAKEKSVAAPKPPQKMILRISDREKGISQLRDLVKQFGGEMITTEGNMFLASLPTGSFPEFEKELAGLSVSAKTDKVIAKKQVTGSLRAAPVVKREEVDEKSKEPARLATDVESRAIVRILLIQE